jgi:hypothetical protein
MLMKARKWLNDAKALDACGGAESGIPVKVEGNAKGALDWLLLCCCFSPPPIPFFAQECCGFALEPRVVAQCIVQRAAGRGRGRARPRRRFEESEQDDGSLTLDQWEAMQKKPPLSEFTSTLRSPTSS